MLEIDYVADEDVYYIYSGSLVIGTTNDYNFANLIAAAPFMLKALKEAEVGLDVAQVAVESDRDREWLVDKLNLVRNAIAEAGTQERLEL